MIYASVAMRDWWMQPAALYWQWRAKYFPLKKKVVRNSYVSACKGRVIADIGIVWGWWSLFTLRKTCLAERKAIYTKRLRVPTAVLYFELWLI